MYWSVTSWDLWNKMVNRACNGCLTRASTYTVPSACSLRTSVTERPRTWSTRCQCDALSVMIRRLDLRSVSSSTAAAETRVIHYIAHWQSLCCLGLAVLVTGICLRQFWFGLYYFSCWKWQTAQCDLFWNITHIHFYSTLTVIQHAMQIGVI